MASIKRPRHTDYTFSYTPEMIASSPATPRESAQLLVHYKNSQNTRFSTFAHLADYLPKNAVLVMNDTKVLPARIRAYRKTGGKIDLLWLTSGKEPRTFTALSPKALAVGEQLSFHTVLLTVLSKDGSTYTLSHTKTRPQFMEAMLTHGTTPTPPYIKNIPLSEKALRARYQTTFAKHVGSVAAPTASLHFSKRLLARLKKQGVRVCYVTLHVGLGTFAPVTEEQVRTKTLHEETYEVPSSTYNTLCAALQNGDPIIPVGTTALRTIESVWASPVHKKSGSTTLFIQEGFHFKVSSGLITNFHVPQSSLLMLVAAFVGRERILALYEEAKKHSFRLFSFGDGMLLLP